MLTAPDPAYNSEPAAGRKPTDGPHHDGTGTGFVDPITTDTAGRQALVSTLRPVHDRATPPGDTRPGGAVGGHR